MSRFGRLLLSTLALSLMLTLMVGITIAQDETVLVIGMEQEAPNLRPLNNLVFGGLPEGLYARDLWDWDVNREIFPIMAESIPTFDNGGAVLTADGDTAVTVTLAEGLLWSDGTPITTADCALWHRVRTDVTTSDSVARGSYPDVVKSFDIVDDRTFTVTYIGSYPDYLVVNEKPECRYPAHIWEPILENGGKLEDSTYFTGGQEIVGYGPYRLAEWRIGEGMTFEANPNWQGTAPAFSRVITRLIPDSTQMRNALEAGEIDIAHNWSDNLQSDYAAIEGVETFNVPAVFADALWIRMGENGNSDENGGTALQDPLVRQAIVHAIDRITLAEQLVGPGIIVPKTWYPSQLWPEDLQFLEYNVEGAVALLTEAGWTDSNGDGTVDKEGMELANLRLVSTENELRNNYQLVIQEYLSAVGIGTEIQIIPATTLFGSFADRGTLTTYAWDLAIFANSAQALAPVSDASSYYCSGIPSAENPDGFNPWQFCDARYDEVDTLIAGTLNGPERDALVEEAVTLFTEANFWNGLRLRATWWALNASVVDVASVQSSLGTLSINWFNQIENWQPAS